MPRIFFLVLGEGLQLVIRQSMGLALGLEGWGLACDWGWG